MKTKREEFKGVSRVIQQAVKGGMYPSVNAGLVAMYAEQGHTEIHSFKQWLDKGFVVRRGEKALLLWGEPRTGGKQEKPEKKEGEENDEFKFWPLAYVFSQKQVDVLSTAHTKR